MTIPNLRGKIPFDLKIVWLVTMIALLSALLFGCQTFPNSNDVFSSVVPDKCDEQGECNVGKHL